MAKEKKRKKTREKRQRELLGPRNLVLYLLLYMYLSNTHTHNQLPSEQSAGKFLALSLSFFLCVYIFEQFTCILYSQEIILPGKIKS